MIPLKKTIISILMILLGTGLYSQALNVSIIEGFENGNAKMISKHFNATIELNVPGIEGLHSKDQANFILKDFFLYNPPSQFNIKHSGNSRNGSHYSIGELTTSSGYFRIYLLYNNAGEDIIINELRIESDD